MSAARPSILFLEKVFLKPPPDPLRGVELFNLRLIADLLALGHRLWIPIHARWATVLRARCGAKSERLVLIDGWTTLPGLLWRMVRAVRGAPVDVVFVANVGNRLIPLLALLRRTARPHLTLLAHREAAPRFVRALKPWSSTVVAVNEQIAQPFRAAGFPRVAVDYGIMDADRYAPAAERAPGPVRFVVLGALENAWKGADTAIAAFQRLPEPVRARCELHLASYLRPPRDLGPGIVARPWMPAEDIPGFLRTMDVMICPSRDEQVMRETFSQAIVQGMLTGLPILASDLAIFREKLDAGGGTIFRTVEELAAAMQALADDPARRAAEGRAGRATALARYRWDTARFVERYMLESRSA